MSLPNLRRWLGLTLLGIREGMGGVVRGQEGSMEVFKALSKAEELH